LELSKDQCKPSDEIELSVQSKPNSFVGLLGIDQSVLILKKGNDIEKEDVFAEEEDSNDGDDCIPYLRCNPNMNHM
jgi:CD109 antigen